MESQASMQASDSKHKSTSAHEHIVQQMPQMNPPPLTDIPAIYTEGDPKTAKYVLIGEAPGVEDRMAGGAFLGKAGQLLNELLLSAGIQRGECRLENVFQFHPDKNDLSPYIKVKGRNTYESEEYKLHRDNLIARLKETTANIIIALGAVPTWALIGRSPITKLRGSVLWCEELERKVIPCIHPSAALREYLHRYNIVTDLQRAREQAETKDLTHLKRELILSPSYTESLSYIQHCREQDSIAYDIEVKGMELSHMALAISPTSAICIPFVERGEDYWTPDQEYDITKALEGLLEEQSVTKIVQNASFDCTFMYSKYKIAVGPLEDTMIAQGILYPDFAKGLDFLTAMYCSGEPYYKDDGKEWMKNDFGSEEIFRRYNAMDAAVLMEIFPKQLKELARCNNVETYHRQKALLHPLVYAGNKGIRMDVEGMQEASALCDVRINALETELADALDPSWPEETLNINSPNQVKSYFYAYKGLKAHTKKGSVTVDDKALKQIARKGHKEAAIILALRKEKKMNSTYYQMELDPDGRLRCSFNPVGTEQGRISSSKTIRGTGANMQNQPSDMKNLMLADEDHIIINQDLGQAENRVVAYVAGEPKMIDAFETGADIHSQTASMIYNVSTNEVTEQQRDWGKRANHGLNYDLGYRTFAIYYQIPENEAAFLVERYHSIYPGVREWHNTIRTALSRSNRVLTNCYGRSRRFLDRWGHDLFKVAYSYIPQSTVGEKMNQDGVVFLYKRQDLFSEVQFLNTVHDSIQYQLPYSNTSRVVEVIKELKKNLERPLSWKGQEFSIPVDTEIGFSLNKDDMLKWKASHVNEAGESELEGELAEYVRRFKGVD